MSSPLRVLRQIVAPAGKHRGRAVAVPVVAGADVPEVWLRCDTTRCAHLTTRHVETGDDQYECAVCGHVTTGGR